MSKEQWVIAHKEHNKGNVNWRDQPAGPFLNPDQPADRSKPRLLCLVCTCGEIFVYEHTGTSFSD